MTTTPSTSGSGRGSRATQSGADRCDRDKAFVSYEGLIPKVARIFFASSCASPRIPDPRALLPTPESSTGGCPRPDKMSGIQWRRASCNGDGSGDRQRRPRCPPSTRPARENRGDAQGAPQRAARRCRHYREPAEADTTGPTPTTRRRCERGRNCDVVIQSEMTRPTSAAGSLADTR